VRVSVLVLDGVFDTGLSVVLDTLAMANELSDADRRTRFDVVTCGVRRTVTTAQGFRVGIERAALRARPDLVIVPALGCKTPETIAAALDQGDVADACALVRSWSRSGAMIAGACTATFVLAASGILDGGRATTTWWLSPVLRSTSHA